MANNLNFDYPEYEREWQKVLSDPNKQQVGETWFQPDTLDAWRHQRMRAPLRAVIEADPNASWLTIGDGRFGTDANFLLTAGAKNVHCTDISDTLLKIGHAKGFIKSFSAENAERLTFGDNSFDYIYCKESLHHFARPYAALYEMFRVAKKGVILTEPRDTSLDKELMTLLKDFIKTLLRKKIVASHGFEPIGNYIYGVSERELEKFLLGMHFTEVAYIGCNDAYAEGVEFVPINSTVVEHVALKKKIFSEIQQLDFLCRLGVRKSTLLTAALFKELPSIELKATMTKLGWSVSQLPINPYR
jgi:ubiquinone/menaquinone biosynthesis C-methylase UbiE